MLIGSITNQGSLQGEMNNANGYLTGVITSAGQLGGQVVGLRGLKGDKGDTGQDGHSPVVTASKVDDTTTVYVDGSAIATIDDGIDGQDGTDGQDGHSPIVTASKVGKVTTVSVDGSAIATINDGNDGQDGSDGQDGADGYSPSASVSKVGHTATITITDKDGTTTADIYDGSGGGASAFIAEYGVTSYADIKDAYDEDAIILCTVDDSGNTVICQLAYFDDANEIFYFAQPVSEGSYWTSIAVDDTWDDGYFQFASTDTATQLRNGLMSALDWQKLDGIASGAEVNVQSDWNEADNTKDDFIKNKPTIPTVNNATLTIQKNGTTVNTFTANASSNVTANITVPTDTGDLTNGAGYITTETDPTVPSWAKQVSKPSYTASEVGALPDTTPIPSKTSDLNNDSGFITGVTSTSTPTASTIAEFDSSSYMNSTDMTSSEVEDFVDELDITGGLLGDYVVEQGTSGIWTYRKWNSGVAECWGTYSYTATSTTQWGSVYYTPVKKVPFPTSLFASLPTCSVTAVSSGVQGWGASNARSTTDLDVFLIRPTTITSGDVYLSIVAKGTWK